MLQYICKNNIFIVIIKKKIIIIINNKIIIKKYLLGIKHCKLHDLEVMERQLQELKYLED